MGMFDSFYFAKGVLPDNREAPEKEFQTKCLECLCNNYRVDEHGWVKCDDDRDAEINEAATVYSHVFEKDKPTKIQYYKILIHNNKVIFAKKLSEEGYENVEAA